MDINEYTFIYMHHPYTCLHNAKDYWSCKKLSCVGFRRWVVWEDVNHRGWVYVSHDWFVYRTICLRSKRLLNQNIQTVTYKDYIINLYLQNKVICEFEVKKLLHYLLFTILIVIYFIELYNFIEVFQVNVCICYRLICEVITLSLVMCQKGHTKVLQQVVEQDNIEMAHDWLAD